MSEIVRKIKEELLKRCDAYNKKYGYDFWNDHIKYVVKSQFIQKDNVIKKRHCC